MRKSFGTLASLAVSIILAVAPFSAVARDQDNKHTHDFLIYVTVFNDRGFSLPGATARVRRATEKKWRWDSLSDVRGEFAIRVPEGDQYEMMIQAKGFQPITRDIDAREGNRDDLHVQMAPLPARKSK